MQRRSLQRRLLLALVLTASAAFADEEVSVPVALQMELLLKVARYDKNLPNRAPHVVRVLLLRKQGDAQSYQVAQTAARALQEKTLNHAPVESHELVFSDGTSLAQAVKGQGVAIVYVTPGFEPRELASIAAGLRGVSVLSAGANARFVETGVVLGFDLVGGKPKLVVHLRRARDQGVDLSSQLLKLAKVIA